MYASFLFTLDYSRLSVCLSTIISIKKTDRQTDRQNLSLAPFH